MVEGGTRDEGRGTRGRRETETETEGRGTRDVGRGTRGRRETETETEGRGTRGRRETETETETEGRGTRDERKTRDRDRGTRKKRCEVARLACRSFSVGRDGRKTRDRDRGTRSEGRGTKTAIETHYSQFTIRCSLFAIRYSLAPSLKLRRAGFTTHYSPIPPMPASSRRCSSA